MKTKTQSSTDKPYVGTQAAQRAIAILQIFTDAKPEWNLNAISAELNLNRTTAYRLITVLLSAGLVTQFANSDCYRLGSEVIALGGRAIRANPVRIICRQALQELAKSTGETSTLEVFSGDDILIVEEHSGRFLLHASVELGTRWPAYATSTGLAMMAFLPEEQINGFLSGKLARITEQTITNPQELRQLIQQSKETGYAVLADALEIGYIGISAVIRNFDGQPVAAISVGGPRVRMSGDSIEVIGLQLMLSAQILSKKLGYRE